MTVRRGHEAKIFLPGTLYFNDVKIFIEETEVGCASEVSLDINVETEPLYTVESKELERQIEGNLRVTGHIRKAWVNLFYLNLLGVTEQKTNWNEVKFDLLIKPSEEATGIFLKNCRFLSVDIRINSEGWLEEEYDFISGDSEIESFLLEVAVYSMERS